MGSCTTDIKQAALSGKLVPTVLFLPYPHETKRLAVVSTAWPI